MKKNKMSLTTELDLTREGTAEMTRWCILIALHQSFGIGQAAGDRHLKFRALYIKSFFLPSFHSSDVFESVGFGIFACRKIICAPKIRFHYSACSSEYDACA